MALAPDPRRIHGVVQRTKAYLDEFDRGYASRYADVYGPQGHGGGRSGPVWESQPTELGAARALKRSATLQAWGTALLALHAQARKLARSTTPRVEAPDGPLGSYPPLISPDEYDALVEARIRRTARGE